MASFDELFNAVKQAQNRGGGVREATSGFSDQLQTGTANRQAKLKAELDRLALSSSMESKKKDDIRADANLRLEIEKNKRTTGLIDPATNKVREFPGISPKIDYDPAVGLTGLEGAKPAQTPKVAPAASGSRATDVKKLSLYLGQMDLAIPIIDKLEADQSGRMSRLGADVPLVDSAIERFKSENRKRFEQAGRRFATAILRPETGAQANESEIKDTALRFLGQPGDAAYPQVLEDKRAARQKARELLARATAGDLKAAEELDSFVAGYEPPPVGAPSQPSPSRGAAPTAAPTGQKAPSEMTDEEIQAELERLQNGR